MNERLMQRYRFDWRTPDGAYVYNLERVSSSKRTIPAECQVCRMRTPDVHFQMEGQVFTTRRGHKAIRLDGINDRFGHRECLEKIRRPA